MNVLAALGAALAIGTADFIGGWASRRVDAMVVASWVALVALSLNLVLAALVGPELSLRQAIYGLVGGVLSGLSINLAYMALAAGAMSLAAPLIACGTALLPTVAASIVGEPPNAVQGAGIAFTLVGIVVITRRGRDPGRTHLSRRAAVLAALTALTGGAAFSIFLLAARDSAEVAVGVAAVGRLTNVLICFALLFALRKPRAAPRGQSSAIVAAGLCEGGGITLLLLASSLGSTAVAAVITSLFAIVTVLLAQIFLRERISAAQKWGVAVSALGVALLSVG